MLTLYFSGTGNSAYIARKFSKMMGATCHSIEDTVDFDALLAQADTVAVCYPIYGSCVPRNFREFVAAHAGKFAGKPLVILCTQMMFSGDGARAFTRVLPGCEHHVIYAEHFNMPNNISNFWLFPIRDSELRRKCAAADRRLERVCRDIQTGVVRRRGWKGGSTLLGKLQNTSWPTIEEKRRGGFSADGDCTHCGLCVKCCPTGNLSIEGSEVAQHDNCILCHRCVNLCPQKAATVMLRTKPERQYTALAGELSFRQTTR